MTAAAGTLPVPTPAPGRPPLELHLLTGHRFWEQTAFCLWSFACASKRSLAPIIYDDGSLTRTEQSCLRRLFPDARFVPFADAVAQLDHHLPTARFPVLRERWVRYPNIRKLVSPHIGQSGWKLVIDSDLLFFRPPILLADWLDTPARPLHAIDCETSYGYSRPLLDRLAGAPVPDLVNVGLCGLDSFRLDWEQIESWCRQLIAAEGTSYYLEQALVAMLVAGRDCTVAPAADYVTRPVAPESLECRAVMHHYVADSKVAYFRENWRRVAGSGCEFSPCPR